MRRSFVFDLAACATLTVIAGAVASDTEGGAAWPTAKESAGSAAPAPLVFPQRVDHSGVDRNIGLTPAPRVLDAPPPVESAGPLTSIPPFVGDFTESWESFRHYLDPTFHNEPSPITIFGAEALAIDAANEMYIYQPGLASWGLSSSGFAQVSDGIKGMGQNTQAGIVRIEFVEPVSSFGAFWAATTDFSDPTTVSLAFRDVSGNLIGAPNFTYTRSAQGDGLLEWHGWRSGVPVKSVTYSGDFVAIDGLQATRHSSPCEGLAQVIDFQQLEVIGLGFSSWGFHVEEDGYQIDNVGPNSLSSFGTLDERYPGSTALFDNSIDGTITVSRIDGGAFTLRSIDIAPLNAADPVTVNFTGVTVSGDLVNSSFTHSGSAIALETHIFPPGFNRLQSVSWRQIAPFHQFDNIVLVCSPCDSCDCPADVDHDGQVAFSDILRILGAWGDCFACDSPGTCDLGFDVCDAEQGCLCFTKSDGDGVCMNPNVLCVDLFECDNGQCPPGFHCTVDTCCGVPICYPLELGCDADAIATVQYPPGSLTPAGLVMADGSIQPVPSGAVDLGSLGPSTRGAGNEPAYGTGGCVDLVPPGEVAFVANNLGDTTRGVVLDVTRATCIDSIGVLMDPLLSSFDLVATVWTVVPGTLNRDTLIATSTVQPYVDTGNGFYDVVIGVTLDPGRYSIELDRIGGFGFGQFDMELYAFDGPDGDPPFAAGPFRVLDGNAGGDPSNTVMPHFQVCLCQQGCDACPCPEDINRDGTVSFADILRVLGAWGPCSADACDTPGVCDGYTLCGTGDPFDCLCWTTFDGQGVCYQDFLCAGIQECPDGNCPPGFVCVVGSCCFVNACVPMITCDQAMPLEEGASGLTGSGRMIEPAAAADQP